MAKHIIHHPSFANGVKKEDRFHEENFASYPEVQVKPEWENGGKSMGGKQDSEERRPSIVQKAHRKAKKEPESTESRQFYKFVGFFVKKITKSQKRINCSKLEVMEVYWG